MRLTFAPRHLQRWSGFYQQLAQLVSAGVTLPAALDMIERGGVSPSDRPSVRRLLACLREGSSLSEGLLATGDWLPAFDIALLHAGEQSGRLPECFRLLSNHYAEQAQLARQTLGDLAYPLFLLHLAVFLFPLPQLVLSGRGAVYLASTLGVLAPLYLLVLGGVYLMQARHGQAWRAFVERLLHPLPLLGSGRRALALARLASALEALLNAGVTVIEAWQIAAAACGSPALRATVDQWVPGLRAGVTPGEAIRQSPIFPELFAHLYQTGEISGKLDESLRHLSRVYQEEGARQLRLLGQWAPRCFYLVVVAVVAFKIVQFWLGYFQQIGNVLETMP
jgi:type II secretory pathway component PulF